MRAATRARPALRALSAPSRAFASTSTPRAGGWDNKPRPGQDSLAHALKSLSSRTRLTRPQTEAYTAIFKQGSQFANKNDRNLIASSRTTRPDASLESLPFDVVMNAIAEADGAGLSLEQDALAYISYVGLHRLGPLTCSSPKTTPASSRRCWSRLSAMTITRQISTRHSPSMPSAPTTPTSSCTSCSRWSTASCSHRLHSSATRFELAASGACHDSLSTSSGGWKMSFRTPSTCHAGSTSSSSARSATM